jgi:hypothetical protein
MKGVSMMEKLGVGVAAAAIIAGASLAGASPAYAKDLGGIDVRGWCSDNAPKNINPFTTNTTAEPQDRNNAFSWKCVYKSAGWPGNEVGRREVNMNAACDRQYGSPAYSNVRSKTNPWSWYCWR